MFISYGKSFTTVIKQTQLQQLFLYGYEQSYSPT